MIIYIGADHRGFALKEHIKEALKTAGGGTEVVDVGAFANDPADDYPDFARAVAERVAAAPAASAARGIVICGSGIGVDIVANKFRGVRSALALSAKHIRVGRNDDDVNVLSLAADFVTPEDALAIVTMFLSTPFKEEERFTRRLEKIASMENEKK
jgi:ribose 5-phosphate isomerase B